MPEEGNTTILARAKEAATQHKGKIVTGAGGGLTVGALLFLNQFYVTKEAFEQHQRQFDQYRQERKESSAVMWRELKDRENDVERLKAQVESLRLRP